jgi:CheY-like chemotaxis protein
MQAADYPLKTVVLVVEDEPLLLMQAVGLVEDAGFEAVVATDADAAIAILLARADIRIVFTDIDMPGSMDGLKLAAAIRDRWPPIEIIVTCDKLTAGAAMLPERSCFFAKPYDPVRVTEALHRMGG